jgi:hypothetical protein
VKAIRAPGSVLFPAALFMMAVCLLQVPAPSRWLRQDATPFDNGPTASVAPAFDLLLSAATVVPDGALVLARSAVPDPRADTYLHRAAVALLPDRQVLPAAISFGRETGLETRAEFVVVLGQLDSYPDFDRVLATRYGSVWRRRTR